MFRLPGGSFPTAQRETKNTTLVVAVQVVEEVAQAEAFTSTQTLLLLEVFELQFPLVREAITQTTVALEVVVDRLVASLSEPKL